MKKEILFFLVVIIALTQSCEQFGTYLNTKKKTVNDEEVEVFVPTGTNLDALATLLVDKNIVEEKDAVLSLGKHKNLDEKRIAAGRYLIPKEFNLNDMMNGFTLNSLGNGNREVAVKVTFNNCVGIPNLAGKVAKKLELDSLELVEYITSEEILNKYGFKKETISALFIPDTYEMYWDTSPEAFVEKMAKEFRGFWTDERKHRISQIGLNSQSEVVTLASIVYKEQDKHKEEWPIIAGLYLNRLKQGWKLQSDPTFRFCWGDELKDVKRLLNVHREIDCPYNTYLYEGLPPGPIYIPPAKVVDAVLNPDQNNYFYMCAKPDGDGLHNFASTLTQHNKNARAYQNWLTKNKIK